jgi:type III restriction enzyme
MLIKAERRDKTRETLTVEVVEKALIEQCKVPPAWIVRATGDERGLDDVDLFAPDCPVRFVITVDALKEGWDCSWAYVLCSVAEMKSDTAIEQIIGRVLRLPQARRKETPALNRAYAFATSNNFASTARALEDALVEGNGFNPLEARDLIVTPAGKQGALDLPAILTTPPKTLALGVVPETAAWSRP